MRCHMMMTLLRAGCQTGPVHLCIDAGATSADYQFTDLAGNAWSGGHVLHRCGALGFVSC